MRIYHLVFITGLALIPSVYAGEPASAKFGQAAAEDEAPVKGWPARAQEILMSALSLTGIKYTYGGESPETGFDCSGFVRYVFQQAENLTLPHGARALSQLGQHVPLDQLQPGDLVFFNTLKSAFSHVGIYIGNKRFIHAPSSGGDIHVVSMEDKYWAKRYNGARRIDPDKVGSGGSRMTPTDSQDDKPGKQ